MNPDRFDALSKTLAGNVTRRTALLGGGAGILAAAMAFAGRNRSDAAPIPSTNWYSAIRRYQLTSSTIGTIEQQLKTGYVPQISQQPGYVEYFAVQSGTNNDVLTTVAVFTSKAQFDAADQALGTWVSQNLANLPNPTETTKGDVVFFDAAMAQICPSPTVTPMVTKPASPTAAPATATATPCTGAGCACNGGVQNACAPGLVCCQKEPKPGGPGICTAADACNPGTPPATSTSTMAPTMPPTKVPTLPPTKAPTMPPTMAPTTPPTEVPTAQPTT